MLTTQSPPRDVLIPVADGPALRAWFWTRANPRAMLVISHGFGEHGGCYRHLADALGPALGIEILSFDFRGHGRSPGRRGVVRNYDDLTTDLESALDWTAKSRPDLRRFVLGHSNGGQVALRAALRRPNSLDGLILSNPVIELATEAPRYKVAIGHLLRRFAPGVTLTASLESDKMTRDPVMKREALLDPLRHSRISAPLFFGMVEGGLEIAARAGDIQTPTLIVLGASDSVIDPDATRRLYDNLGSIDKTLLIYPKMLHEPLNELGREQVFADITHWIDQRLDTAPA